MYQSRELFQMPDRKMLFIFYFQFIVYIATYINWNNLFLLWTILTGTPPFCLLGIKDLHQQPYFMPRETVISLEWSFKIWGLLLALPEYLGHSQHLYGSSHLSATLLSGLLTPLNNRHETYPQFWVFIFLICFENMKTWKTWFLCILFSSLLPQPRQGFSG